MWVAACNKEEQPGGSGSAGTHDPVLEELSVTAINGTDIKSETNLAGLIKDSKTGKGIEGVPVTDGYSYTKTDANGVYQMKRNDRCRKVYYTTPAEYAINLDSKRHMPCFYSPEIMAKGKKYRVDFVLDPLPAVEDEFSLIMIGDPQCYQTSEVLRYKRETVEDIKNVAASGKHKTPYCITLGDITHDSTNLWDQLRSSMSNVQNGTGYIPFFQCIGNHDHNSLEPDSADADDDDYRATAKYVEMVGPTDYSFNRGKVHVVVMDDIMVYSQSSSSKPNGKTWDYYGGFSDAQYEWFKQDIANVKDPANTMLVFCAHIPFRGGASNSGSNVNTTRHYADFLNLFKTFKECHIMIGHTHYAMNWIHNGYVCKGGKPIYEHVHQAACGAWWTGNVSVIGDPNGYNIYDIKGSSVADWVNKATNYDTDYQIRVFDGNQVYNGTKGYQYAWYNATMTYAGVKAYGNANLNGCFVVEAWDDDDANCTVEYWQDGKKVGNFTRIPNGGCCNIAVVAYWFNEQGKSTDTWSSRTASHYWYYKPASATPAKEKNWEVRFNRTIPSSGVKHTYTCTQLTTDYTTFYKY